MGGVAVDFLSHPALTTPVPALLSLVYSRPIIDCTCRRARGAYRYEMSLGEPLSPDRTQNKKIEIKRLPLELNRRMSTLIREHPEQYFWVHDRWKLGSPKRKSAPLPSRAFAK